MVATVLLGMLSIAAGLTGYLLRKTSVLERVLLLAAGFALAYPSLLVAVPEVTVLVAVAAVQAARRKSEQELEPVG